MQLICTIVFNVQGSIQWKSKWSYEKNEYVSPRNKLLKTSIDGTENVIFTELVNNSFDWCMIINIYFIVNHDGCPICFDGINQVQFGTSQR